MTGRPLSAFAGALVLGATAALPVRPAFATDVQVRVGRCGSNVELSVRDARLSDVLARLAKALDFEVRLEGGPDPLLTVSMSAPATELVAALAAEHGSFMIRHAADTRCPGRKRVAVVWLTPKAAKAPVPVAAATAASQPRRTVVPVTETATRERLRQVEEEARRRKEAYDIHVRRYGKPPPDEPEEAAMP